MKVAFLGLGSMGRPMAANVARAGHGVVLWNPRWSTALKDVRYVLAAGIDVETRR